MINDKKSIRGLLKVHENLPLPKILSSFRFVLPSCLSQVDYFYRPILSVEGMNLRRTVL